MGDVKFYLVEGKMLIRPHKMPEWWKFRKYVRALKPEHAVEKVLSELGSNHKIKRYHIKIERVVEVPAEEVPDRSLVALASLTRWIKP
ncbi:50S ribosomal protein L18Ae [Pyrodictium delaneyi]|uniref:Large ribosomal subunit protein eL20 n=1 Tax=Pyrodictium delaneyi TaxID=1273541 RepID=A0A0P0N1G5_9CREN|nr:50S ribosomal protein L18Ae [Pyrodictium delaneyi]ALL00515.1 50S ribosomal protein L18Ae [Pyrodictium delaneyi]OWJ53982.1 50S ribosomal protein L18a [Pyrodictium delaneyi]